MHALTPAQVEVKRAYQKMWTREKRAGWREQVLRILGGHCVCCEETNFDVLEVDHINNDGKEERKKFRNFQMLLKKLRTVANSQSQYQLLCANCHTAKTHDVICIHRRAEVAIEELAFAA